METTKENRLGVLPVEQLIRQFAVPSIIAMLVGALYNIVDQFFIGRSIGELGNAATNVAFPLTTSCVAVALLFGIGGASSFNLALGRKQKEQAVHYMGNAAVLLFVLGTTPRTLCARQVLCYLLYILVPAPQHKDCRFLFKF